MSPGVALGLHRSVRPVAHTMPSDRWGCEVAMVEMLRGLGGGEVETDGGEVAWLRYGRGGGGGG